MNIHSGRTLSSMKSRSLLLLGVMLVSPAWSQEPATNAPVLTPQSFDRSSDSIRKIVRDVAASQSVPVRLSAESPVEREPVATFEYVPPEKSPTVKSTPPRLPTAPAPASAGPLSAISEVVFETLVDTLLDADSDDSSEGQYERWHTCQSRAHLKTTEMGYETCPGENHGGVPR